VAYPHRDRLTFSQKIPAYITTGQDSDTTATVAIPSEYIRIDARDRVMPRPTTKTLDYAKVELIINKENAKIQFWDENGDVQRSFYITQDKSVDDPETSAYEIAHNNAEIKSET
jgi:hypothetical protein